MSAPVAVAAALGAAACAAVTAVWQHRAAACAREPGDHPTSGLRRFARSQAHSRLWWFTLPVQAVTLVLHATALHAGALILVQPLLVCSLVLAVPLHHYLAHRGIARAELMWAAVLTAGIAGFLLAAGAAPVPHTHPATRTATAATVSVIVAVIGCIMMARRARPVPAAGLLGAAAGIAFAGEAAFLQTAAADFLHGTAGLLSGPAVYGLAVAGAAGVALTQLAYRAGPLSAGLAALTILNPFCSIAIAITIDHGRLRHTPAALAAEILGLGLLTGATIALTRPRSHDAGTVTALCRPGQ